MKTNIFIVLLFTYLLLSVFASAQETDKKELEKAIQNPIAKIVTLPFQNNADFGYGSYGRLRNTLNIMPVLPFSLGKKVSLITRTIIPVITQPVGESDTKTGLGDITLSTYFSPSKPGKLIWGVGPVFGLPTATDDVLGSKKWSAGPAIIMLVQPEGWTLGLIAQNTWSFAGDKERPDVNFFYSQVFLVKNLPNGWYINSAPIITSNWKAASGSQWTVPVGFGAGNLHFFGKLPVNFQGGYYYYVVKPEGGPMWQLRAMVIFVLPKFY
jgi:hypothetical protein